MSEISPCLRVALHPLASAPFKILAGVTLLHTESYDAAEDLLEDAVRLRPDRPYLATAVAGLGIAAKARGDLEEARSRFERALALDGEDWEYHYHLAETDLLLGNDLAAVTGILRALQMDVGPGAARALDRNPFFAEILAHPAVHDLVMAARDRDSARGAALLPASAWGCWEAGTAVGSGKRPPGHPDD